MFEAYIFPILLVTGCGLLLSAILVVAAKFMAVKTDETYEKVRAELPGVNCGACGYAGCDDYARALCNGEKTNLCIPGGDKVSAAVSTVLGVEVADVEEQFAIVKCGGNCNATDYIMDYEGVKTCAACNSFYQGRGSCSHACLGFGDGVLACKYDAIHIVDGVAVVDKSKCVGCGMCARECPNHLIDIIPATSKVYVSCSSHDKGAQTRKVCRDGCIGCKKCEKACPSGAITVTDNLAHIDPKLCTSCGVCVGECPTGAIKAYQI